jgi:hypothetical protein
VGVTAIVNKIFAYTAAAHKEDMEDEELLEVEKKERDMSRLGIAACSFGNTFTLPLVFLTEVLGPRARGRNRRVHCPLSHRLDPGALDGWVPSHRWPSRRGGSEQIWGKEGCDARRLPHGARDDDSH